ncbi:MAG: DUF6048 family protein [Flavobacteriaceae bacterium]|nr:DUF6048 family protein [Flavobacteriaceae bacterium]
MKTACIWHYIISFIFIANLQSLSAQSRNDSLVKDKIKAPLTLRFGIDLFQPTMSQFDNTFKGFEIVGDLRINENLYLSSEIGTLERTQQSELINFTTSGSYLKFGVDFNMYKNWTGMNNQVFLGIRFANSLYNHNINNYVLYRSEQLFGEDLVQDGYSTGKLSELNAQWIEFLVGMKVQVLKNTYMGFSLRLNRLLGSSSSENFGVLFIPGFNRVTDENIFGSSFNYTITYSIPFRFRKSK